MGRETKILLGDGKEISAWDVAAGQDLGEVGYHFTTNSSPANSMKECCFFTSGEVVALIDPISGANLL